jgi:hypothetical protein
MTTGYRIGQKVAQTEQEDSNAGPTLRMTIMRYCTGDWEGASIPGHPGGKDREIESKRTSAMSFEQVDPSLPGRLRAFHERLPLAGNPPSVLLALPDDRILYLAAVLRDMPVPAPALSPEEWQVFLDLLRPHGVYALLAHRLSAWPESCRPPAEVMDLLKRQHLFAAARAIRAGRQIQTVVDALEAGGIPSVLLKGPALARTVYPDPALRQSSDIDLLVRPGDVIATEVVLEGLGYVSPKKEFHVSQYEYHHQVFEPPVNGLPLELHWSLDSEFGLFPARWVEEVISRRIPIGRGDIRCFTLSPNDHLLFLAFHNTFPHEAVRLDWIVDTALVMARLRETGGWQGLVERSVEHHIRIPLELTATSADLWGGHEAQRVLPDVSTWPTPSDREQHLWKYATTRHTSVFSSFYLALQGQPGLVEKVRYGRRYILPPTPMIARFRRSSSRIDIPLSHIRRWARMFKYI